VSRLTADAETAYRFLTEKPAQYGQMLGYTKLRDDLHGDWIRRMVLGKEDMTLQAHRGSYKTTCDVIALVETLILRGDINNIFLRKTDNDVHEVISAVLRALVHPVTQNLYKAMTGNELVVTKATSSEITTSNFSAPRGSAQLLGIGIGGSLTGKHAERVWTDDIVNLLDRKSRAERERTKDIYQELQNIRNPGGRIINTGTPWHKDDAFALMPEPIKYNCYQTGLIDRQKIDLLRKSMTPSLFAANYELVHIASENALFTTPPVFTGECALLRDGRAHIDAAYGGDDWTAFTCCKKDGNTLYMYGRIWQKHVDTVLDTCIEEAKRLMCGPIWCEDNGDKGFLAKEIRNRGMKSVTYHEYENKNLKISTYLRKWWDNIIWLEGTDEEYINQIMDYTEDAEHDDAPDSASVLCRMFDKKRGTEYHSVFGG
jgi:hypothetical protein